MVSFIMQPWGFALAPAIADLSYTQAQSQYGVLGRITTATGVALAHIRKRGCYRTHSSEVSLDLPCDGTLTYNLLFISAME